MKPVKLVRAFKFTVASECFLTVEEIWSDGDAPQDPSLEDVLEIIAKCGGSVQVIRDWNLLDNRDALTITDDDGRSKVAP